jgi:hypothetical protein
LNVCAHDNESGGSDNDNNSAVQLPMLLMTIMMMTMMKINVTGLFLVIQTIAV